MFSGKSEELIRRVKRAVIARRTVQVFKPAIDDRFDLHSDELMSRYRSLASGTKGWDEGLDTAAAIVWERNTPVESLLRLSSGWTIAWQDDGWFIACHAGDTRCA